MKNNVKNRKKGEKPQGCQKIRRQREQKKGEKEIKKDQIREAKRR